MLLLNFLPNPTVFISQRENSVIYSKLQMHYSSVSKALSRVIAIHVLIKKG